MGVAAFLAVTNLTSSSDSTRIWSIINALRARRTMAINDMDFFHQATMRICGSLDIDEAIRNSFDYLKSFIPMNGLFMNHYDSKNARIQMITIASDHGAKKKKSPIPVTAEIQGFINSSVLEVDVVDPVILIDDRDNLPIKDIYLPYGTKQPISFMALRLRIGSEFLGILGCYAKGRDRFSQKHIRLMSLLNDPFAVALSNTLRYQEVLQLKELLADDNQYLRKELRQISGNEIIGDKFGLSDVMESVRQVAPLDSQVLVLGETGVGKEVIANAIHYSSPRSEGPFIKVNCGAIPENLIDSELFGHEKGAFTGAVSLKRGRFERADKGTIFLDEIGELPPQAQVRLLRVIQNREIERVGGEKPFPVDIRIIAATHRNLEEMVREGTFREDLWFRINIFPIRIPSLRERTSDIPALVNHFIERKSKQLNLHHHPVAAPGAIERLKAYEWPGNVRELENLIERALIKNRTAAMDSPLSFEEFFPSEKATIAPSTPKQYDFPLNLDEANRLIIQTALNKTKGKVQGSDGAASILGVHPNTLRNRMRKLGIPYGRKQVKS